MARPAVKSEYPPNPYAASEDLAAALEQRVRRLEDAVAALQDTHLMEDRLVERVVARVEPAPASGSVSIPVERPSAVLYAPPGDSPVLESTLTALPDAAQLANLGGSGTTAKVLGSSWLIFDVFSDLRTMFVMLIDYRHRLTWLGRMIPLAALVIALLSWLFLSGGFFGLGTLIDRAILIVLTVIVYKVMLRETHRYREFLARIHRYR